MTIRATSWASMGLGALAFVGAALVGACSGEVVLGAGAIELGPIGQGGGASGAACPSSRWATRVGFDTYEVPVAFDSECHAVLGNGIDGQGGFAGGFADERNMVVTKLDETGTPTWSTRFGEPGQLAIGLSVAVDGANDSYVAGCFGVAPSFSEPAAFVAKVDAAGQEVWSRLFASPGSGSDAMAVVVDPTGGVVVLGTLFGAVDFGGGTIQGPADETSSYLLKLDSNGNHVWSKAVGGTSLPSPHALAIDGSGNLFVASSRPIAAGASSANCGGGQDVSVTKLDALGFPVWSKCFGDAESQLSWSVGADAAGNVVLAGLFRGTIDFGGGPLVSSSVDELFVVKLDGNGNHIWSKAMVGPESQALPAMAVDRTGRIALAGGLSGSVDFGGAVLTSAGDQDAFVVMLDASGNYVWGDRFGDEQCQSAAYVAFAGEHGVLVSGWFTGTISFGGRTLTPWGGADQFVAMVGP